MGTTELTGGKKSGFLYVAVVYEFTETHAG